MPAPVRITRFAGLHNKPDVLATFDPETGTAGLTRADNVFIDNHLKPKMAEGFTALTAGTFEELITSLDEQRGYVLGGGTLSVINDDLTLTAIHSGLPVGARVDWAEVNELIYLKVGSAARVITPDHEVRNWGIPRPQEITITGTPGNGSFPPGMYRATVTLRAPDGRESGAPAPARVELAEAGGLALSDLPQELGYVTRVYLSQPDGNTLYYAFETLSTTVTFPRPALQLGIPLRSLFFDAPPEDGLQVAHHRGRFYISRYFASRNVTALYPSEPLAYEWFDAHQATVVPGKLQLMNSVEGGLLCVTDSTVTLLSDEGGFVPLADYGSPSTQRGVLWKGQVYFWTERGICRALPFENLTEDKVSLPPGDNASGVVIESGGVEKYVVLLDDAGSARNAY